MKKRLILTILVAIQLMAACTDEAPPPKQVESAVPESSPPQASAPAPSTEQIRPETVIKFRNGTYACLTREDLQEFMQHAAMGEETKANAMGVENGGDCFFLPPTKRVRVISAQYNTPDIGILEIVGAKNQSANGAWALSIGAEPVK